MKDTAIINLFFNRSERAIKELERKYHAYLYSISHNILRNKQDTEECINDVYMRVWKSIPPDTPRSLMAYIGEITRRLSIDIYRKKYAKKRGQGAFTVIIDELEEILASGDLVEDVVIEKELIKHINSLLSEMSKDKRLIFVMRYYYAYEIKEIASKLGISQSKVKTTLYRMRIDMRERLEKGGYR